MGRILEGVNAFVDAIKNGSKKSIKVKGVRMKNGSQLSDTVRFNSKIDDSFPNIEQASFIDVQSFQEFKQLSNDRLSRYVAYEKMLEDSVISGAVDMYADDSSQFDNNDKVLWVTSTNPRVQEYLNILIKKLKLVENIRTLSYSLIVYGDAYYKLFKYVDSDLDKKLTESLGFGDEVDTNITFNEGFIKVDPRVKFENYVELVDRPEDIYEVENQGLPSQYIVIERNDDDSVIGKSYKFRNQDQVVFYPPDQFVHFCLDTPLIRNRQVLEFDSIDEDNERTTYRYKVKSGHSILNSVYSAFRELELIENAIIMNRLSKSAVTRLFQVEVGNSSKKDTRAVLNRVKNAFEGKISISAKDGMDSYANPGSLDNVVVSATRNGKGQINPELIGGDVDVTSLADLDFFNNKKFSGLRVPKIFFGFDDNLGNNSGGTLAQMDNRYGRVVKRIQSSMKLGYKQLFNLFLIRNGMADQVDNFTVNLVSPTTNEDNERSELLEKRINVINQIINMINDTGLGYDKKNVLLYLLSNYFQDPEFSKLFEDSEIPIDNEKGMF